MLTLAGPPPLCPLCGQLAPPTLVPPRQDPRLAGIERAILHVQANLTDPLSVADLARVAGMSPVRFATVFRKLTGESPHRFVIRRRIERALELILAGIPLAQVALDAGFSDQAHFTTTFKSLMGVPPGQWRWEQMNAKRRDE